MSETPEPDNPLIATGQRKACQISIMFPVEEDTDALVVKSGIDKLVGNIKDKRYTFNITEM